jgi:hypothetical protein
MMAIEDNDILNEDIACLDEGGNILDKEVASGERPLCEVKDSTTRLLSW